MGGDQLSFLPPEPPAAKLTARQTEALFHIGKTHPIDNETLGAFLHSRRRALRGHGGHALDDRCQYCTSEGTAMGRRLRELGYVRWKRGHGWYIPGVATEGNTSTGYDPATAPFPDGF